jgi:hypothetical protein
MAKGRRINLGPKESRSRAKIIQENCLAVIRRNNQLSSRYLAQQMGWKPDTVRMYLAMERWPLGVAHAFANAINLPPKLRIDPKRPNWLYQRPIVPMKANRDYSAPEVDAPLDISGFRAKRKARHQQYGDVSEFPKDSQYL